MNDRSLIRWVTAPLLIMFVAVLAGVVSRGATTPSSPAAAEEQVAEAWVARYNGPGSGGDGAFALAVDGSGNVYVTGASYGSGTDYDYATIKYGPDGAEQWVRFYNGPGNGDDEATALAVDGDGNVYVTGFSRGTGTDYDYATIMYDADGSEQWVRRYDGPGNYSDYANALAVDGDGYVYVTGQSWGSSTASDYATIKYGPDGSEQWVRRYNGPGNSDDVASALAVDGDGYVYVTGHSWGAGTSYDYATIKYGPDGSEQWVRRYNGLDNSGDLAFALAVDGDGYVYVTGFSWSTSTYYDYATIKYGSDGSEQWVRLYNGPGNGSDYASALAVDGANNVYVAGYSWGSGTGSDYATIKYGPDGSQQWVARYNGPGNSGDEASALAVDGAGNVYVTGRSDGSSTSSDYATIKYGSDGGEQWVARYNGPGNGDDKASALAVDGAGNAYVTGQSWGSGTDYDYATIKYVKFLTPTPTDTLTPTDTPTPTPTETLTPTPTSTATPTPTPTPCPDSDADGLCDWQEAEVGTDPNNPDTDGDGMGDLYEVEHGCLEPLVKDATADPDGDGLINLQEFILGTNPCSWDTDGDGLSDATELALGTNPLVLDTDQDRCADGEEVAGAPPPKPGSTGAYNPLAWYDFFDVPVPSLKVGAGVYNGSITMGDVLAVLSYVGERASPPTDSYVADVNGNTIFDGLEYDRSPSSAPNPPWEGGPGSGAIAMSDVLAVLAQVGLSCAGPP